MKKIILVIAILLLSSLGSWANLPSDSVEYTVKGKIAGKSGAIVKMQKFSGDAMPLIGQTGVLSKSFETELFGGVVTGWMSIGEMKVTSVAGDIITFSLIKELSVITEDGVKKNNFEIGKEVKFVWKVLVSADEAAYQKGQEAVENDMDLAMTYYREAVAANPFHANALNMIGMIMNEKEQYDSAYYYFKKAADIDSLNLMFAKNVCIASYKGGNTASAFLYAGRAVTIDSKDGEAYYLRGLMNYLLNKDLLVEATRQSILADLDKAIGLSPEESFYFGERAFLRKEFGDFSGACEDAKKAVQLGAEDADLLLQTYCQ